MQNMQHEKSGLPDTTSYAETSFGGDELVSIEHKSRLEKAFDFIQRKFQNVSLEKLGPLFIGSTKGNEDSVVWLDKDLKEKRIFKKRGTDFKKDFPQEFPEEFQKGFLKEFLTAKESALKNTTEKVLTEDRDTIREERQRLVEA